MWGDTDSKGLSFFSLWLRRPLGFPGGTTGKESAFQCRRHKRHRFNPWAGKIPWRRKWQPAPVFFPGKFHGQRSLVGYSPWGHKELDTIVWLNWTELYPTMSLLGIYTRGKVHMKASEQRHTLYYYVQIFFSWAQKSLQAVTIAMKLKDVCSLEGNLW